MRPYDVKTEAEILQLDSDNHPRDAGKFSVLHCGDSVSIHAPNGEGFMSIPVEQFNALVEWYITDQSN